MIVGILGGGQLARMLALAGLPLGLRSRFLDPTPDACAGQVGELVVGAYDDPDALAKLAAGTDAVTYEFENVPEVAARILARHGPLAPPPVALASAQDRLAEKSLFRRLGIPTADLATVDSEADLTAAVATLGLPAVLKTRRLGYDGKGQRLLREPADVPGSWLALGGVPCILERLVPFSRELSILAVRGRDGDVRCYPLIENTHAEGILRVSLAPAAHVSGGLQEQSEAYARSVLEALGYVGLLAIELFEVDGQLIANELAPRVHNSGHWTIEGAETSQFENHLRAVLGWPLGSTASRGYSAMVNIIGTAPETSAMLAAGPSHLHLYGKAARPGRKIGHVTVVAGSEVERAGRLDSVRTVLGAGS